MEIVAAVIYNPPITDRRPREEYEKCIDICLKVIQKAGTVVRQGQRARTLIF